jgi:pimeloyl-ACP methyl ester carboxylesterase
MDFIDSQRHDLTIAVHGAPLQVATWHHHRDRSGARPVLLIHGFRGDHHGMDLIAHYLRHRPVIVPDLPGFGGTPAPEGELDLDSYLECLDGLHSAVTEEYGTPPMVVGHSFGSILTAHWAAARANAGSAPDRLVLINPIASDPLAGPARLLTRATVAYYRAGAALPAGAAKALLSSPLIVRVMSEVMATTDDPGLRRYIHDQHARYFSAFADRRTLARAYDVSISHTVAEAANALTMPVAVIAGSADQIAPLPATEAFIASLPAASATIVDGVGHLIHYEAPETAAEGIEAFLA